MAKQLTAMSEPVWLSRLTADSIVNGSFPVRDILRNSLYYPASGFDGDPIKYLGGLFRSFVYVDYGLEQEEFDQALHDRGFRGYRVLAKRAVAASELFPRGWTSEPRDSRDTMPPGWDGPKGKPFCTWVVFEHSHDDLSECGERFSLLYWHHDGVEAFQALYVARRLAPKAIAIIQPGYGFGGNWTDFTNPENVLARHVLGNPVGQPKFLLFGGFGRRGFYREPCWPGYQENLFFFQKAGGGSIGVWRQLA